MASVSSANPEIRAHLLKLQRNLAAENNVVMDGRDIGTPDDEGLAACRELGGKLA